MCKYRYGWQGKSCKDRFRINRTAGRSYFSMTTQKYSAAKHQKNHELIDFMALNF
jgi:hypothetical protein